MKIILASGSPRRKELLHLIVSNFEIMIGGVDETLQDGLTPEEQAKRLAYIKAKDIFEKTSGDRIVIGADTIVTKNGKIYGKPKNEEKAKKIIRELLEGNRIHSVITGLCILVEKNGKYEEFITYDETQIYLNNMTDIEIQKWIDTGKAFDKAGAYGIQDEFCVFVDKIDGNYSSVIGLPTHKVYDILKNILNS